MNYDYIKINYGKVASWAIWNENDITDAEIIEKNINDLNPNIIMIGLNISGHLEHNWQNFHSNHRGSHDRRLMKAFNQNKFRGAYMTDFIKNIAEPKSVLVNKYLNSPYIEESRKKFEEELRDLGSTNPLIILFGSDNSKFVKSFKKLHANHFNIKNIPHYSSWGSDSDWINNALKILK
jgi:hypothetical protein